MTKNYSISQLAKTISIAFSLGLATLVWTGCKDNDDPDPCESLKVTGTAKTYKLFVTPQGGVAPYTYSIGGSFQSDSTFSITEAKEYTVSVKDANACTATNKLTVTTDMLLGDCKGFEVTATAEAYELFVTPTGGTAPYSYSIDGTTFQADSTFDIATAKEYTVTVKDKNNCSNTYKLAVTSTMLTTFKDKRDNQTYKVVKIGDQIWMAQNLAYNTNTDTISSSYYKDDETQYKAFGRYYSGYVALNGASPEGWHLPSQEEWEKLFTEVGGIDKAHYELSNVEGFNVLLGGYEEANSYGGINSLGYYWTSTVDNNQNVYQYEFRRFNNLYTLSGDYLSPKFGLNIRCIKN